MNCKEEDGHSGWLCVEVVSGPRETMDESSCVPENKESTSLSAPATVTCHYCTPTFQRTAGDTSGQAGPRPALLAFTWGLGSYHYAVCIAQKGRSYYSSLAL